MDFETKRKHLANLSEQDLHDRFWKLANEVVHPLIELAKTHTSPSIERSVLLRMGFNSVEAQAIVKKVESNGLLGKGAGHVVYRYAKQQELPMRQAGQKLAELEDWDSVKDLMSKGGRA